LESRAHAHLGSDASAVRAAEACVEVWQDARAESVPDWLHYMNQAEVDCLAANAYIELALHTESTSQAVTHAERAEQHALSARASRAHGCDRSRVLGEIRLAKVRLAQHDVAESVTVAQTAVELAAPISSTVVCDWLLRFHGELVTRYPHNGHVVSFTEHLREYVRRAAPHKERKIAAT
jgi:hypothetical protein